MPSNTRMCQVAVKKAKEIPVVCRGSSPDCEPKATNTYLKYVNLPTTTQSVCKYIVRGLIAHVLIIMFVLN
jgi:hypothetical protein